MQDACIPLKAKARGAFTQSDYRGSVMRTFEQRAYQRARKQSLKARGLCQDCGQFAPEPQRTMCWRCLQNRINREKGLPRLKGTVRPHGRFTDGKHPREDEVRL